MLKIAEQFEKKYLGNNEEIIKFAKFLIIKEIKNAAKDLNRAIKLFVEDVNPKVIICRIIQDYPYISNTASIYFEENKDGLLLSKLTKLTDILAILVLTITLSFSIIAFLHYLFF